MEDLFKIANEKAGIRKLQIKAGAKTEQDREFDAEVPIISLNSLHADFERFSQIYQLNDCSIETNGIKNVLRRIIKKIIGWYVNPLIEMQKECNVRILRILDASVQTIDYIQRSHTYEILEGFKERMGMENDTSVSPGISLGEPHRTIIICTDSIIKESNIDEVLLIYHYYNKFINRNSHLIILSEFNGVGVYLQYLLSIKEELKIRNVHFVINPDEMAKKDFCNMANAFITLSERINLESLGTDKKIPIFCRLKKKTFCRNIYDVSDMNLEGTAELMDLVLNGVHDENG